MKTLNTTDFPPNAALKRFDALIGTWNTTGTHGLVPDTTLHGQTSFAWHESGAFIIMRSHIQEDVGIPTGMGIIASDDDADVCLMAYYDVRGVSRHYSITIKGNVVTWWRTAPDFSQRYSLTISEDGRTMVGKGELSKDGATWDKDLDLTYTKIRS